MEVAEEEDSERLPLVVKEDPDKQIVTETQLCKSYSPSFCDPGLTVVVSLAEGIDAGGKFNSCRCQCHFEIADTCRESAKRIGVILVSHRK